MKLGIAWVEWPIVKSVFSILNSLTDHFINRCLDSDHDTHFTRASSGWFFGCDSFMRPPMIPVITSEKRRFSNSSNGIVNSWDILDRDSPSSAYKFAKSFGRIREVSRGA